MVLTDNGAHIWGHATPQSRISANVTGAIDAAVHTTADADGLWRLLLPSVSPVPAWKSSVIRFSSSLDAQVMLNLTDILFGSVWVCS